MENEESKKTLLLRVINAVQLIGCIIGALIFWSKNEILIGFIFIISSIITLALLKGFSDIINLLDSINDKLNK